MRKIFTIILCFQFFVPFAQSVKSSYQYTHFTSKDGLPGTELMSAFEDSRGYIWVICDRGAARYDGYDFKTYTTKNGLPGNNVLLIGEDRMGKMWFMSSNGQYSYMQGDSIIPYAGNKRIKELLKDKLPGPFFFDEGDTLWITTFSGIQLFKCVGDSVTEFTIPNERSVLQPTYYLRKVGEKLLALKVGDIAADNKLFLNDKISYLLSVAGDCKLACSAYVGEDRWMVAGPGGYVVFDEEGNIKANFEPSPYLFSSMDKDRSGNIWICNSNGAYRLDSWEQDPNKAEVFFEGQYITSVLQDRAGNYWFTDRDNGLFYVPEISMHVLRTGEPSKQNKINSVKVYDDKIYFGDAGGQVYQLQGDSAFPLLKQTPPSGVSVDFSLLDSNTIIVGNKPSFYNLKKDVLDVFPEQSTIRKAVNAPTGALAFALSDGVGFISTDKKWSDLDSIGFKERCNEVFYDAKGILWIGANSGLYSFDGTSVTNHVSKDSILQARIMDVKELDNGVLAIATRNKGIIFYGTGETILLNETVGLVSDLVDCIYVQDEKTIWAGSGKGLTRVSILDLEARKFEFFQVDYEKGLSSNEVNDITMHNGIMYVATGDGLCFFDVNSIKRNTEVIDVAIDSFSVNGEFITLPSSIALAWNENNLRIDFSAICYRTGKRTLYRYRAAGLNDNWTETTERFVQFMSLPAGEYVFELSAMNEDGLWNPTPATISFSIPLHFTKTWWFMLGAILLLAVLAFVIARFFMRLQKKEFASQAKMNELKHQALSANMNPHFIFNALNSVQHYINQDNALAANDFMADFSKLIRMNMETTRHTLVTLQDELERLELYLKLEQSRFGENMNYKIEVSEKIAAYDILIPPMLLQPYTENAIWHGILPKKTKGNILVSVKPVDKDYYTILIEDDGVGIKHGGAHKPASHNSMSMGMNSERLRLLKQSTGKKFTIKVEDLNDVELDQNGTRVTFVLPLELDEDMK